MEISQSKKHLSSLQLLECLFRWPYLDTGILKHAEECDECGGKLWKIVEGKEEEKWSPSHPHEDDLFLFALVQYDARKSCFKFDVLTQKQAEQLLEVAAHLSKCEECRASVESSARWRRDFATMLLKAGGRQRYASLKEEVHYSKD